MLHLYIFKDAKEQTNERTKESLNDVEEMIRFMMLVKDKMNPSILRLDYKRLWYQKKHLERVCVLFLTVVPPHS